MPDRTRVNVQDHTGRLAGWFILESATLFREDSEYVNDFDRVSVNTRTEHAHQTLYRTAKGQWVLCDWTDYADSTNEYRFISDESAKNWLTLNKEDAAVEKYFGALEDEAGPNLGGRPTIGPRVETRLPADILDRVNAYAAGRDRADVLRDLIVAGLDAQAAG
ncbi:hypothetical protein J7E96_28355 [Streptomyces sp. ISL-96]|uniref:hypothetical protein n=1 Tax=Streptomyces sp. ISL-96 TaxID=2819191 RepID=UPI001BEC06EB|nr:hypothetical protein [Streptomyces sp. ISL-96]MBT2492353.1 hypothetical protein [Streptomyces sp. ISL-96]